MKKMLFILMPLCLLSQAAFAGYYSTLETGRLLAPGHYKLGLETQFVTEGNDGLNLAGTLDGAIDDEWGWKGMFGFGTTDIFLGGFAKWVPFPDTEKQPAVGVLFGALYASYSKISELSLRAHPFVSKTWGLELGEITPYAALPLGLRSADSQTDLTVQIALGTEFRPAELEKMRFQAEIGFDLDKAFPYFSLGATLDFDEENGIEFK